MSEVLPLKNPQRFGFFRQSQAAQHPNCYSKGEVHKNIILNKVKNQAIFGKILFCFETHDTLSIYSLLKFKFT